MLIKLLVIVLTVQLCSGSAIPIWEFLNRNEKMSHLYSTFAKLVSDYCRTNNDIRHLPIAECKRDLLSYASDRLQSMPDANLDLLDPYQRGANQLIWDTIMRGHPNVKITTKRPAATLQSPAASPSSSSILIFGNNKLSSNGAGGYIFPKNPLFDDAPAPHDKFSMDMDVAYGNDQHHYRYPELLIREPTQNYLSQNVETSTNYLSGPLVIRVRPDGTPVEEDKLKPLPRDDDRDALLFNGRFVRRYYPAKLADNQQAAATAATITTYQQRRLRRQYRNSSSYRVARHH